MSLIDLIKKGKAEKALRMIMQGKPLDEIDEQNNTVLMTVMKKKYKDIVSLILASSFEADLMNKQNNVGETALMLATKNRWQDIIQELIERGANVGLKDKYERNALHFAVVNKDVLSILLLVDAGISLDTVDAYLLDVLFDKDPFFWTVQAKRNSPGIQLFLMAYEFTALEVLTNSFLFNRSSNTLVYIPNEANPEYVAMKNKNSVGASIFSFLNQRPDWQWIRIGMIMGAIHFVFNFIFLITILFSGDTSTSIFDNIGVIFLTVGMMCQLLFGSVLFYNFFQKTSQDEQEKKIKDNGDMTGSFDNEGQMMYLINMMCSSDADIAIRNASIVLYVSFFMVGISYFLVGFTSKDVETLIAKGKAMITSEDAETTRRIKNLGSI